MDKKDLFEIVGMIMKTIESESFPSRLRESIKFGGSHVSKGRHTVDSVSSRISLKQWKMFHAVVDCDGFKGAANFLHISQSAISCTLTNMQNQLGVALLRIEGRKSQVTEEGKILLQKSRALVRNAIELESLAENLRQGRGPEIRIVVNHSFPSALLMLALRKLASFPLNIRLSVDEATTEQAEVALHDFTTDLAIATDVPAGFDGRKLIEIEYIAVAHPDHSLFTLQRDISSEDLAKHLQIVISGSHDFKAPHLLTRLPADYARLWKVSDFDTAFGAIRNCLGYAWLPKYRVQQWLDQQQIRALPLSTRAVYKTSLYLVFGHTLDPDSDAKRFADVLFDLASKQSLAENANF